MYDTNNFVNILKINIPLPFDPTFLLSFPPRRQMAASKTSCRLLVINFTRALFSSSDVELSRSSNLNSLSAFTVIFPSSSEEYGLGWPHDLQNLMNLFHFLSSLPRIPCKIETTAITFWHSLQQNNKINYNKESQGDRYLIWAREQNFVCFTRNSM